MKRKHKEKVLRKLDEVNKIEKSEEPKVFKIAAKDRREFIKDFARGAASIAGLVALTKLLASCEDNMDIEIQKNPSDNTCSCHVVCTCDKHDKSHNKESSDTYDSEYNNSVCTCDQVCTCNSVCTCNTVCTCDTEGGSYSYTYYYYA
jgi:hypothetical protein